MSRISAVALAFGIGVLVIAPGTTLAQTTRGCNLPPQFPCPDARIMSFEADRTSIKPGESLVLTWVAENPGAMFVTPGVGPVIARGSARVSPAATTTYTLSVGGGPNGQVLTRTVTITVAGTTAVASTATTPAATQGVPRMPDGRPNLQGVFSTFGARGAGPGRGGAPPAPGVLPRTPTLKPGMESYRVEQKPDVIVSDCVVGSVPPSFGPYLFQIIQTPDYVVLFYQVHAPLSHRPARRRTASAWRELDGRFDRQLGRRHVRHRHGRLQPEEHRRWRWRSASAVPALGAVAHGRTDPAHRSQHARDRNQAGRSEVFEGPWGWTSRYAYHPEFKRVEEYMCAENPKEDDYLLDPKKEIKLP